MKTRVELAEQVLTFIRSMAPEPCHLLRQALREGRIEHGDIKSLEGELGGFWRLRVGCYRVVFRYVVGRGERVIRCEFAERRSVVYEVFAEEILQQLRGD